jgi:DNA-binding response OmpR family regulator
MLLAPRPRAADARMLLAFPPFRLDLVNDRLRRGEREIRLRPTGLAVLRYLADRPGRLVSGADVRRAVPDVSASAPRRAPGRAQPASSRRRRGR